MEGKSVDLGGRRIIKKNFFQAEDGIRDIKISDWSSDVCSSDLPTVKDYPTLLVIVKYILKEKT